MNKTKKTKLIPYAKKLSKEKGLIEEGTIGDLKYKLFDRGNIQITDGVSTFRKDCGEFIEVLTNKDFEEIKEGENFSIPGAGDTDPLVFFKEHKDYPINIRVGGKVPEIVRKLKEILNKV